MVFKSLICWKSKQNSLLSFSIIFFSSLSWCEMIMMMHSKKNKIQKNESRIHCEFFMKRDLPTNWGAYGIGPTTHGSRRLRAAAHIKVTSQGAWRHQVGPPVPPLHSTTAPYCLPIYLYIYTTPAQKRLICILIKRTKSRLKPPANFTIWCVKFCQTCPKSGALTPPLASLLMSKKSINFEK